MLFNILRYAGSAYLIYLGVKGIFYSSVNLDELETRKSASQDWQYLVQGFLCNVLNPKTMLFFLSIFSQVVSTGANDNPVALSYGLFMVILHGLWFSAVALFFTTDSFQARLLKMKKRLNQLCGAGLLTFGAVAGAKIIVPAKAISSA